MTRFTFLFFSLTFSVLASNAQSSHPATEINECPTSNTITGVIHAHLEDCIEDLTITSTINEGIEGTIITGNIISNGKISIRPGYSRVRILSTYVDGNNQSRSINNEGQLAHKDEKSKVGGSGSGSGGRHANSPKHKHDLENTLLFYPNPAKDFIDFSNYKQTITYYQISNNVGKVLKEGKFSKHTTDYKVDIEDLKTGTYIINISIYTGETTTKLLIKN